jgi:hypothetical protein
MEQLGKCVGRKAQFLIKIRFRTAEKIWRPVVLHILQQEELNAVSKVGMDGLRC